MRSCFNEHLMMLPSIILVLLPLSLSHLLA